MMSSLPMISDACREPPMIPDAFRPWPEPRFKIFPISFRLPLSTNQKAARTMVTQVPPNAAIAMYYHVLPYIATYYHVQPCNAMYSHLMPCIAMYYNVLPCFAMYHQVLPCIAMYAHVLPYIAIYSYWLPCFTMYYHVLHVLPCIAMYYHVPPCIAMYCHEKSDGFINWGASLLNFMVLC